MAKTQKPADLINKILEKSSYWLVPGTPGDTLASIEAVAVGGPAKYGEDIVADKDGVAVKVVAVHGATPIMWWDVGDVMNGFLVGTRSKAAFHEGS